MSKYKVSNYLMHNIVPFATVCLNMFIYLWSHTRSICDYLLGKLCLTYLVTTWTVTCQAPLSLWFSRQEYWSGLPLHHGIFPDQGSNPYFLHLQANSLPVSHQGSLPRSTCTKILSVVIFFCLGAFGGEFILSLCFSEVLKKDFLNTQRFSFY